MTFEIKGKVALISGGASGIGLKYAKELLKNDLKGVILADSNDEFGTKAIREIQSQFGPNRAIFVRTDVTNMKSYEAAFKKTVETFGNLDILINNAGILNDAIWEKAIAININGVLHGVLLGLENYIPKYKSDSEGVIVNISSIAGLKGSNAMPVYSATKFAVIGMSTAFGDVAHYNRTKVRVLTLCPGGTNTSMFDTLRGKHLGPTYEALLQVDQIPKQKPESVASALVKIIRNAKTGTVWVAENDQDPYEYLHPPRQDFAPK